MWPTEQFEFETSDVKLLQWPAKFIGISTD